MSKEIIERISEIRRNIEYNMEKNTRISLSITDIMFIYALSGGKLRINYRNTNSPTVYKKILQMEEELKKTENVIFSSSRNVNGSNLLIGDLVDVDLYSNFSGTIRSTLLRNIDLLIIPDRKIYRYMKDTQLKRGSVCQKLLELDSDDIVDTVFKINSFKMRSGGIPAKVKCTEDLVKLTDGGDFILLLSDDLAFMAATIEDENGKQEPEFYLISCGKSEEERIKHLKGYSMLSLYISTPELFDE